jgi:hypothetical protein
MPLGFCLRGEGGKRFAGKYLSKLFKNIFTDCFLYSG